MAGDRETILARLLDDGGQDADVLGVFLFGSRATEGFADERSDYDVCVVVRDDSDGAFAARWPYRHGAEVEVMEAAWTAETLLPRLGAILDGTPDVQQAVFRDVEGAARAHGHGDVLDSWEPDVAWLRGEAAHRT